MVSSLELVLINLKNMGFFAFLPFLLTAAVFYGLLRRSKLFGEPEKNVVVNAVIAITAAFLVWAYPIISGTSVEEYQQFFSTFFLKGSVATLTILIGLIIFSMFFPEGISATLGEKIKGKFAMGIIILSLLIATGILLGSGTVNLLGLSTIDINTELIYSIVFIAAFVGIIGIVVWLTSKETKK